MVGHLDNLVRYVQPRDAVVGRCRQAQQGTVTHSLDHVSAVEWACLVWFYSECNKSERYALWCGRPAFFALLPTSILASNAYDDAHAHRSDPKYSHALSEPRSMLADPEGRDILRARPVINEATVDLAALAVSMH